MNGRSPLYVLAALMLAAGSAIAQPYQWVRSIRGNCQAVAFNPLSNGRTVFVASYDSVGLYRSDDGGHTWRQLTEGLEPFSTTNIHQILVLPSDTNIVLAVSPSQLYRSTNGGNNWSKFEGLGGIQGEDIVYHDATDAVYYGQNFAGPTWKSVDHGGTWIQTGAAVDTVGLCTLAASPDSPPILLAGSEDGVIVRSGNEGALWTYQFYSDTGVILQPEVPKIVYSDYAVSGGLHSVALATRWLSYHRGIVKTTDNGVNWTSLDFPSRNAWALDIDQRQSMLLGPSSAAYPGPQRCWTGLFHDRSDTVTNGLVQESTNGGQTWHGTNFPTGVEGNENDPITRDVWVIKFDTSSGKLAAATSTGFYITETRSSVQEASSTSTSLQIAIFNRMLSISSGGQRIDKLEVTDLLGRSVKSQLANADHLELDCSDLTEGVYMIAAWLASGTRVIQKMAIP